MENDELLTLREAAIYMKVHPNTLRNWDKLGKVPAVRIGTRKDRRFYKSIIETIIQESKFIIK